MRKSRQGSIRTSGSPGFILALGLLMLATLALIGTAALSTASIQTDLSNNARFSQEVYYAASAGLGHALKKLTYMAPTGGDATRDRGKVFSSGFIDRSTGDYTLSTDETCIPDYASGPSGGCSCPYAARNCIGFYVEVVFKKAGNPPPGWDLNFYQTLYFQVVSTASSMVNGTSKSVGVYVGTVLPKQYGTGGSGGGS